MSENGNLKLLVRPRVEASEGVAEYLQRLAKANGYPSLQLLINLFKVPLNDIVVAGHVKLRAVIEGNSPPISLKISKPRKTGISPYHHLDGVSQNARVCCSCLKETDVLSPEWSEPLSIVCSRHEEILLDRCPRCSRRLLRRESQYRCFCGQEFASVTTSPSPPWLPKFYELFCPWRIHPIHDQSRSEFLRAEIWAARMVTRLLGGLSADSPPRSISKAWIYTSDHKNLWILCRPEFDLGSAILEIKAYSKPANRRPINFDSFCSQAPESLNLVNQAQIEKRKKNMKFALQRRKISLQKVDSVANFAKTFKVNYITAMTFVSNQAWQENLRKQTRAQPAESLLSCANRWISSTYSLEDVQVLTGISGNWLKTFSHLFRTESLGSTSHSIWRFPKEFIDNLIIQISQCSEYREKYLETSEGFIPMELLPEIKGISARRVFNLLADGALPLVRPTSSAPTPIKLMDCLAPISVIERLRHKRYAKIDLQSLIQYRESSHCHS